MISARETANEQRILRRRRRSGEVNRWKYGLAKLDRLTGGIASGECITLLGDSGIGKSALAGLIAYNLAEQFKETNLDVRYVSREMSALELQNRLVCQTAQPLVPLNHVRDDWQGVKEELARREEEAYDKQVDYIESLPLRYITEGETFADIREQLEAEVDGRKCGFFIVDHLSIMPDCDDPKFGYGNIGRTAGEIFKLTQSLAPALTLCQILGDVAKREDKRPMQDDAYGGRRVTHNSTLILALYSPTKYIDLPEEKRRNPRPGSLYIRKSRNGDDQGEVRLVFLPTIAKWVEDERKAPKVSH